MDCPKAKLTSTCAPLHWFLRLCDSAAADRLSAMLSRRACCALDKCASRMSRALSPACLDWKC
eukprot:9358073-Alexandrium_andersonii.AAC.1